MKIRCPFIPLPDPHSFTSQVWTIFCCSGQAFCFGRHQRFLRDQDPSIPHVYDDGSWRDTLLKDFQLRPSCDGLIADCCCSVTKSCPTLCDPMDCSMSGFPVFHYLPELAQMHVHWAGDAIQPSHPLLPPFSSCFLFPSLRGFSISRLFASGSQSIGASAPASVLPMNTQGWYPLGWTTLTSWMSKGHSIVFSYTTVQKHQFFGTQYSL